MLRPRPRFLLLGALGVAAALAGCTPHIGDRCNLNTDCSISNTRQCDNSQPNGYCTVFNCAPNSCPDNAACVVFQASVPGCPYDDYASPARSGRSFCMATCQSDSDCRTGDGYVCMWPNQLAVSAVIVDTNSSQRVCVLRPTSDAGTSTGAPPPVCPGAPRDADAGLLDTGAPPGADGAADSGTGGNDGGGDSGTEAGADAASDGAAPVDAAPDVAVDASTDAGTDATLDATADGGGTDASTGDAADTGAD
jgi:hypothetical protein